MLKLNKNMNIKQSVISNTLFTFQHALSHKYILESKIKNKANHKKS